MGTAGEKRTNKNEARALRGKEQTAQRAEVAALARALASTKEQISVVSDSRYTVDRAKLILEGKLIQDSWRHRDLWHQIPKRKHLLKGDQMDQSTHNGGRGSKAIFYKRRVARKHAGRRTCHDDERAKPHS